MELGKAAAQKPTVKRELVFDSSDTTPKKAKAPLPPKHRVVALVTTKTESGCPTAAKSGPPCGGTHVPSAEPKHVVPTPVPTSRKAKPTTKVEHVVSKPVATPARAAEKPTAKHEMKEAAASLRRMTPLPSVSPTAPEDSGRPTPVEMTEQRLKNKQGAMTEDQLEVFQLENAILDSLVEKTDDEIYSMIEAIKQDPMFPKFAQEQIVETGLEDWSFDDVCQIPTWEIWHQKFMAGSPHSTSTASVPTPVRKAGALHISPPPKAAVEKPAAVPPVAPKSTMPLPPPPPKQVAVPRAGPSSIASPGVPKTTPVVPKTNQAVLPKTVQAVPKTVPVLPKTVPVLPKTVPVLPKTVPVLQKTVPALPKTNNVVPKTTPVVPKTSSGGDGSMSAFAIGIKLGSEVA